MLKHPVIAFFKLIRLENLLIIALTIFCVKHNIIDYKYTEHAASSTSMYVLMLSTILIAAAGYMINDYFDVKTDMINRPETVVIDKVIKRRWAMVLHIILSSMGLILGVYLAVKHKHLSLVLFQISAIVLLWFYSTDFKKQLLIGNIIVSLLSAIIPIMPWVYVYASGGFMDSEPDYAIYTFFACVVLSLFAFFTSFAREIIKDMEDFKGDIQTGCKTMPIQWGIITSKVFTFFLIVITMGLLLYTGLKLYKFHYYQLIYYIIGLLLFPLSFLLFLIIKASTSKDFKTASLFLKLIMLSGITFTFFI